MIDAATATQASAAASASPCATKAQSPVTDKSALFGLNDAVAPLFMPEAESVTAPEKPPDGAIVILLVPCEPRLVLRLVGEAETVKLADTSAVTFSETVAVCVSPPPVPVTVAGLRGAARQTGPAHSESLHGHDASADPAFARGKRPFPPLPTPRS